MLNLALRFMKLGSEQRKAIKAITKGHATIYGTELTLGPNVEVMHMALYDSQVRIGEETKIRPKVR